MLPTPGNNSDEESKRQSPPLSARSDSSSSSAGSRSALAGLTQDDLKTTSFSVDQPAYRSVDIMPPHLSRAADVGFGFQDFNMGRAELFSKPASSVDVSASSASIDHFETLPTIDRHNLEVMPKNTYIVTNTEPAVTAEKIFDILKRESIIFETKRKSNSTNPVIKGSAYSQCCTRSCEFNVTMYANEMGETLVEIIRYAGDCCIYRPIANTIFSAVSSDSRDSIEVPKIPMDLSCEPEVELPPPPPLSKALATHITDKNPLPWLTTLAVATNPNLTTGPALAENVKDILESDLLGALLAVSKSDDKKCRILALAVLRNVIQSGKDLKDFVSALPELPTLLEGLLSNSQNPNANLQIAYLSVTILSGLLSAAPRTVGKALKMRKAGEVFKKCCEVGLQKHFLLSEAAIQASTDLDILGR